MGVFNNGFPVSYPQPYYGMPQQVFPAQMQPQQPTQNQQDQRVIHGFDWVLGDEGAKAYLVPAGKTFILFDASPNSEHFFLKSTDQTGKPYPAVKFDYKQHQDEPKKPDNTPSVDLTNYISKDEFNKLKDAVNGIKSGLTADEVREIFDSMIEERFAPAQKNRRKVSEE